MPALLPPDLLVPSPAPGTVNAAWVHVTAEQEPAGHRCVESPLWPARDPQGAVLSREHVAIGV